MQVLVFAALACLLSWPLWFAALLGWLPLTPLGAFGPAVSAILLTKRIDGSVALRTLLTGLVRWRVSPLVYAVAIVAMPLLHVLTIASTTGFEASRPAAASFPWYLGLIAPLEIFILGGPLGEELGWRGYALDRLLPRFGGVAASVGVAILWFAWHLPLFWVRGSAQADLPKDLFALTLVAYSVLLAWLWTRSGGSTLLAMIFHTSANASFWAVQTFFGGALSHPRYGIIFVSLALGAAAIAGFGLPRASRPEP